MERFIHNPVTFAETYFQANLEDYQKRALLRLAKFRKLAWCAAHGVGKTATLSLAVYWFLCTRPFPLVVTTLPTGRQVRRTLWSEMAVWYRKLDPRVKQEIELLTQEVRMKDAPTEWKAFGFSAAKGQNIEGLHNPNVLIVVDEAKGVAQDIFDSLEGATTSPNTYVLWASTPGPATGEFYKPFSLVTYDDWSRQITTAYEAPEWLISREWIADKEIKWGRDNPLFRSKVLAQFISDDQDQLILMSWLDRAEKEATALMPLYGTTLAALDVARSTSGNENVFRAIRIEGNVIRIMGQDTWRKDDTMYTVGRCAENIKRAGAVETKIDLDGLGAGVYDRLKERGYKVRAVRNGMPSHRPDVYPMQRDEMYFDLSQRYKDGQVIGALDDLTKAQLLSIRTEYTSGEKLKVESKEKRRRRNLESPDRADALAMALYTPPDDMEGRREGKEEMFKVMSGLNVLGR